MHRLETLKRDKDGLEVLQELPRYAREGFGAIPAEDLERLKWAGLFHRRRAPGTFMLRVRVPGGRLLPGRVRADQLEVLAELAEAHGRGVLDLTTRQQVQLRWLRIEDVPRILERLEQAGLTSLQTGGDNVRNVTGCAVAGLDAGELLDAAPVVRGLTRLVLGNRQYSNLPHKFNIAVTGCRHNCIRAEVQDVALTPLVHRLEGRTVIGFNVRAGGRLGSRPRLASVLDVFVTGEEAVEACRRLLEIYRDLGGREMRAQARLGDLIEARGAEWLRGELERRLGRRLPRSGVADELGPVEDHVGVHPQRQVGLSYVGLAVPAGRLTARQARELARLAARYGSGEVRLTQGQNAVLVDVPEERLADLLREPLLQELSPDPGPFTRSLVACAGREQCNLAQMETKERALALARLLDGRFRGGPPGGRAWRLHVSGCQASCGQHQVADIGLVGKTVERDGRAVEAVDIYVGGRLGRGARFGRLARADVPCDELPAVLVDLIRSEASDPPALSAVAPYVFMQQLLAFCRVVETGSFTRAARDLALTQPAVTKQIKALEGALGAQVIDRRPGACGPTAAGAVAYAYARRILALMTECCHVIAEMPGDTADS